VLAACLTLGLMAGCSQDIDLGHSRKNEQTLGHGGILKILRWPGV